MMPRVVRLFWLFFLLASLSRAETLEEAVRSLAQKVSARLQPGETARVADRNLSSLAGAESARARAILERALRRAAQRDVPSVEIALTIAENVRGYLLVAEIRRGAERAVEMVSYRPSPALARRSGPTLEKKLLWEQDQPMLDVAVVDDQMLVLDTEKVALYARRAAPGERAAARLTAAAPGRDPRGRLEVTGTSLTVHLPGGVCRGTWKPALELSCEADAGTFLLDGDPVRFSPGRNTLQAEGWPLFYAWSRWEGLKLLAEPDGRVHLYDAVKTPASTFEDWGGDFVAVETGCGRRILAAAAGGRDASDSVAAYEIVDRKPRMESARVDFPGPVTALWTGLGGALAIVRDLSTGRYAAYSLTLDCGR